jgi:hypothetical protein
MSGDPTDPGVCGTIDPSRDTIIFREAHLDAQRVARYRPFDQAKSDAAQPIRAVVTADGARVIMQGNHRVYGAQQDRLTGVGALLYTPEQWGALTGMPFRPGGTQGPQVS